MGGARSLGARSSWRARSAEVGRSFARYRIGYRVRAASVALGCMTGPKGDNLNGLRTAAVVPVKRFATAHERLAGAVSAHDRARLAEALFRDLLSKIRRSRRIDHVLIVTADETVARHAR